MSFEISKDGVVFPQSGVGGISGDAFKLIDRDMLLPQIVESGITEFQTFTSKEPGGSIEFSITNFPKVFFSKTYDNIPYFTLMRVNQDHASAGFYINPEGVHPFVGDSWNTALFIEKDGFRFSYGNFFGASSGAQGVFAFKLYWAIYNIDYLGDIN